MPKKSVKSRRKYHKYLLPGILAGLILVVAISAWAFGGSDGSSQSNDQPKSPSSNGQGDNQPNSASPNLSPATTQEKQATEDYKKSLSQPTPPAPASGKAHVYPVITSASHTQVNAYVAGTVENGGTCTATATQGTQSVMGSLAGSAAGTNTSCAGIPISLPNGAWTVVVTYSSAAAEGKSQTFEVN